MEGANTTENILTYPDLTGKISLITGGSGSIGAATRSGRPDHRGGVASDEAYHRVARTLINWIRLAGRLPGVSWRPVEVNGGPGALLLDGQQRLISVLALDIKPRHKPWALSLFW